MPDLETSPPDPLEGSPAVHRSTLLAAVEQLVAPSLVRDVFVAHADRSYRARVLTIELVFFALLQFVLGGFASFAALVGALRAGVLRGLPRIDVTDRAFYLRLEALPHTRFLAVLHALTSQLRTAAPPARSWVRALAPFASGVYAIDDTTLDALARKVAILAQHPKGAPATLGGRLGVALDLCTGQVATVLHDADAAANEKAHLLALVESLGVGALVVLDLGYFAFPLFDALSERSIHWVTRLREKTSFVVVATLADRPQYRDRIVRLGKWRSDRAARPVRLVELETATGWQAWLTNVLDPQELPAPNVWALYAQRWTIEMVFAALKRALGLAYLRPCHTNGVLIQIWCTLCVYQVLQQLRLSVAAAHGWNADRVSWERLVRQIGFYSQQPSPPPLVEYLCAPARAADLVKQGTRTRRQDLPAATRAACEPVPILPAGLDLAPGRPRQGRSSERQVCTVTAVAVLLGASAKGPGQ